MGRRTKSFVAFWVMTSSCISVGLANKDKERDHNVQIQLCPKEIEGCKGRKVERFSPEIVDDDQTFPSIHGPLDLEVEIKLQVSFKIYQMKVDDKHGLAEEEDFPLVCRREDVQCQRVDSRVRRVRRRRRSPDGPDKCDQHVSIEAFGSMLSLRLCTHSFAEEPIVAETWDKLQVSIFKAGSNVSDNVPITQFQNELNFATGYVENEKFTSVSGFLVSGRFYGTVYMRDSVHYLEPHDRHSKDMHIMGDGLSTLLHKHTVKSDDQSDKNAKENEQKGEKEAPKRRICEITVVADHLFFKEVGQSSVPQTLMHLLWHIKEANALFSSKDFDGDGQSECIGFRVAEITIFQSQDVPVNLLKGEFQVPEDFLKTFSRYNFDGFCLGILFTSRAFNELVLGLSWRGNPKPDGVGGICQGRVRIKSDNKAYSFNALFISLKSSQEERIPLRMGVLNLVHEIMHSFGAKHDPAQDVRPECTPKDRWLNGRYLMSKYSNDGHKLNHEILSPCTRELVHRNLQSSTRIRCLKEDEQNGFCGDGIVNGDEQCDCGTTFQCIAARSCCLPPEGFEPGLQKCSSRTEEKECQQK